MLDLHTHILPGMDDGSPDPETSAAMLRLEAGQGVKAVCASSHYYRRQNSIERFCQRRAQALERLGSLLSPELPRVIPAAEVAFFSGISECPGLDRLCIGESRTLLLEMPFAEWNDFQLEEVAALVLDRGFGVILAHPERFCGSRANREKLAQLGQLDIGWQVNASALLHWRSRKLALELLRQARRPLLASDCHNLGLRPPNLNEGRTVVMQKLGEAFLARMDQNAAELIAPAGEAAS